MMPLHGPSTVPTRPLSLANAGRRRTRASATRFAIIAWGCVVLGLSGGVGVAQMTTPQQVEPRTSSKSVAPEPPELVPQPAGPHHASSEYDPLPTPGLPNDGDPFSVPGHDTEGPQFKLPEVRVDSAQPPEFPSTEPGQQKQSNLAGAAIDPTPMLQTINEELSTAARRESDQFDSLQQGLRKLRQATESMRQRAQQDQKLLEQERRRSRRAERLAEDARQQAEHARVAAEETLRRFQELRVNPTEPAAESAKPEPPGEINSVPATDHATDHATTASSGELSRPAESPTPAEPLLTRQSIVTSAVPVTDDTVDRESLANNLFGAQQYRLALPIYADLAKQAQSKEDELWYEYQLACCYRNLGSFPQAEKHYRIVAGNKESYLAAMARWYLSLIQDQKTLREQLDSWELVLGRVDDKRKTPEGQP